MIHFLPESPRYDVLKGRSDRALATFRKIYPSATEDYLGIKLVSLEEVVAISTQSEVAQGNLATRWKLLCTEGKYRRPAITALGIGIFQQLCGFNSLSKCGKLAKGEYHNSN